MLLSIYYHPWLGALLFCKGQPAPKCKTHNAEHTQSIKESKTEKNMNTKKKKKNSTVRLICINKIGRVYMNVPCDEDWGVMEYKLSCYVFWIRKNKNNYSIIVYNKKKCNQTSYFCNKARLLLDYIINLNWKMVIWCVYKECDADVKLFSV